MKVRALNTFRGGTEGVVLAGTVFHVDETRGRDLIAAGRVVKVEAEKADKADKAQPEAPRNKAINKAPRDK